MIKSILIANRGEIACRIIKTARELGIKTIAIYSEADKNALHVANADLAFCVGGQKSSESYLNIAKIIEVAKLAQVDAIHPGYGFLSENAQFSNACFENNIIFIGPSATAIEQMGSKIVAKQIMEQAKVPLIPGYHGENQDSEHLLSEAKKIGFPVLIKAAAGGGGKGMKIVHSSEKFFEELQSAKREAKNHFADDKVLLEKYFPESRHVEIQIIADQFGEVLHLFERDCSIQRRYQKVVEEAPAPNLREETRSAMAAAAIQAAKAINYLGAGTVEFLVDAEEQFYFMEMNTRLQVEHPISELITGIDLVAWQISVAEGKPLPWQQSQIKRHGHAFEVRLYAEDPLNQFLPSIGNLEYLQWPVMDGVRIDTGIQQQDCITPFYDPLLAKIISWADNRDNAILKMHKALADLKIIGIKTNQSFLRKIFQQPELYQGAVDTRFINQHYEQLIKKEISNYHKILAIAAVYHVNMTKAHSLSCIDPWSPWQSYDGFRLNLEPSLNVEFILEENTHDVKITFLKKRLQILIGEETYLAELINTNNQQWQITLNNETVFYTALTIDGQYHIFFNNVQYKLQPRNLANDVDLNKQHNQTLAAPMPGTIVDIFVNEGDQVKTGDKLITMEAMKMEHSIFAPLDGIIESIPFAIGTLVNEGTDLIIFKEKQS